MNTQLKEIEEKALSLPIVDREILATHLFQSVHNQEINEIDESWLELAHERFEKLIADPSIGVSEEEFFLQMSGMRCPKLMNITKMKLMD